MLDIERLCINCRISLNFQNKILCKRPVCYQIETEEYDYLALIRRFETLPKLHLDLVGGWWINSLQTLNA